MKQLLICPRCKKKMLDRQNYGESAIYQSMHRICVPCWKDEDAEIEREGGNNLPVRLKSYGPPNDYED